MLQTIRVQQGWASVPVFPRSLTIQVQVILQWSDEGPFSLQSLTGWPQPITKLTGFITALQCKEPEALISSLIGNHESLHLTELFPLCTPFPHQCPTHKWQPCPSLPQVILRDTILISTIIMTISAASVRARHCAQFPVYFTILQSS